MRNVVAITAVVILIGIAFSNQPQAGEVITRPASPVHGDVPNPASDYLSSDNSPIFAGARSDSIAEDGRGRRYTIPGAGFVN
jgi:hypothetical protein